MNLQADRIVALCQSLQLERIATEYAGIAQRAAQDELSFSDFLEWVLKTELDSRHERTRSTLLKLATLPAIRSLVKWTPFSGQVAKLRVGGTMSADRSLRPCPDPANAIVPTSRPA